MLEVPLGGGGPLGLVRTFLGTPGDSEVVELADIAGSLASTPTGGDALQVGGQTVRVTQQCHPLARIGQSTRLLDCHEGLAAAGATANLDAPKQLDRVEDDGLLVGEDIGGVLVVQGAGDDIALRQAAPAEGGLKLFDARGGHRWEVLLVTLGDVADARHHVREVVAVDDHPARTVGQREAVGDTTIR